MFVAVQLTLYHNANKTKLCIDSNNIAHRQVNLIISDN